MKRPVHRSRWWVGLLLVGLLLPARPGAPDDSGSEVVPQVVQGNNAFAVDLYSLLGADPGNLFFSPWSLSTALGLVAFGAAGVTRTEMMAVLHLPDRKELPDAFGQISRGLRASPGVDWSEANGLFVQRGFSLHSSFLRRAKESFGAEVNDVDFQATEAARQRINQWVSEETREMIPTLFVPGVLQPTTRLVVANALYFQGAWDAPFDPDRTYPGQFDLGSGDGVEVPLMSQEMRALYLREGDLQVLDLAYQEEEFSLTILLPTRPDRLAHFDDGMDSERLHALLGRLRPARLRVVLPRFAFTSRFTLSQRLRHLGIREAFTGRANFQWIVAERDFFLQEVVHEARVELDEKGTKAAAATGGVMGVTSVPPSFEAVRPFLFLIRHRPSGTIVFMGRVADPRAE